MHGGDGARVAAALGRAPGDVLDLSASLNPVAPDVREIFAGHLDAITRYPDPGPATAALADHLGLPVERVLVTNGGAEAIALLGAEIGGSVDEPDFSLYPRGDGPRWRSNPHSPTGRLAARDEWAAVWDEAFWPLATGTWTRGDAEHGAWVVGSLTKLFAVPGLRAGYVIAPAGQTTDHLRVRQPAWSVNGLVCEGLFDLLALVDLSAWSTSVARLRAGLVDVLAVHDLDACAADGCWVLVEAPGLRDRLARRGVVVRDCTTFGMPGWVRIAVPSERGLEVLDAALR
jgi:histidinol-phosphate/aromatic aminotransferase/cobyric acid decarboxylase-like protein